MSDTENPGLMAWMGMGVAAACAFAILFWCSERVAHQKAEAADRAERSIVMAETAASAITASRAASVHLTREIVGTQLIRWVDRHSSAPAADRIQVLLEVKTLAQSTKTPGSLRVGGGWVAADTYSAPIPGLTDAAHERLASIMLQQSPATNPGPSQP